MSEPKRHHFLPICYLSGFSDENGKLSIYDRKRNSYRSQRADSVAFEKYLYSWILPDGSKDQGLEKHFGKIESHYPAIRDALERGELLTQEEMDPLLAFIALQLFRVPATLGRISEIGTTAIDDYLGEVMEDEIEGRKFIRSIFGEESAEGRLPFREFAPLIEGMQAKYPVRNSILRMLLEHAKQAYVFLNEKPAWTVVHAPFRKKFITSDRPVLVHKANPDALGVVGLLGKGSRIFMPLSSRIGINLGEGPPSLFHRELGREDLWGMNSSMAISSYSLVIADSEQRLKAIVSKTKLPSLEVGKSITPPKRKSDS